MSCVVTLTMYLCLLSYLLDRVLVPLDFSLDPVLIEMLKVFLFC